MIHSYVYTFVQIPVYLQFSSFYFECSFESANKIFIFHFATCSSLSVTLKLKVTVSKLTCLPSVDHRSSMQSKKTFILEGRGGSVRYRC